MMSMQYHGVKINQDWAVTFAKRNFVAVEKWRNTMQSQSYDILCEEVFHDWNLQLLQLSETFISQPQFT